MIINILERRGIHNLQSAAKILIFLQNNDIADFVDLEKKVKTMHGEVNRIKTDLRAAERRIDTRDALHAEHRRLSQQGLLSKGKVKKALEAADAYADKHFAALLDYDDAEKYLSGVLQRRFDPKKLPVTK